MEPWGGGHAGGELELDESRERQEREFSRAQRGRRRIGNAIGFG